MLRLITSRALESRLTYNRTTHTAALAGSLKITRCILLSVSFDSLEVIFKTFLAKKTFYLGLVHGQANSAAYLPLLSCSVSEVFLLFIIILIG